MNWLKQLWLDLIVTVLIIAAAVWEPNWAVWIVLIYTPVMLILKVLPLAGGLVQRQLQQQNTEARVPFWVYHALYAVNAGVLLAFGWWSTGAAWLGIWLLSFIGSKRRKGAP